MIYKIPFSCGKVYLGETERRVETRLKEHKDACRRGQLERSAVAEHPWTNQHTIRWEETSVVIRASRRMELRLKKALSIQLTPEREIFNRDEGMELPGCWAATIRAITRLRGQRSVRHAGQPPGCAP